MTLSQLKSLPLHKQKIAQGRAVHRASPRQAKRLFAEAGELVKFKSLLDSPLTREESDGHGVLCFESCCLGGGCA